MQGFCPLKNYLIKITQFRNGFRFKHLLGNCNKFALDKSTVSILNKENKFKPCLTEQLLNMFDPLRRLIFRENWTKSFFLKRFSAR